jgi:pimeloyl-ACP methyl ester carboxylesterase
MNDTPLDIQLIRDTEVLRAWRYVGQSRRLVVCFSGLGKDQSQPPGYEFSAIATGGGEDHVLYIADPNRSWLNQPGLVDEIVALIDEVKAEAGVTQVVALGHSMGGFSACVLPHFTPVDYVLALSPQVSVHPDIVPDDPRWMTHRAAIDNIDITDVASYLMPDTYYVVVYGRHGREAPQRDRFPNPDHLSLFVMPLTNHNTAARLKGLGLLTDLRDLVFDGRIEEAADLLQSGARAYQLEGDPVLAYGGDAK